MREVGSDSPRKIKDKIGLPLNMGLSEGENKMKKKKYTRKLTRVGKRSLCLVVPKEIVEDLDLREKQKMTIYRQGKKIIVTDWDEERYG